MAAEHMGMTYKIISMPANYMDDWHFDFEIIPGSFHNQERSKEETDFDSEVQWVTAYTPEFFLANKDKYLEEKLAFRGKSLEEYNTPPDQPSMPLAPDGQPTAQEQPQTPGQVPNQPLTV